MVTYHPCPGCGGKIKTYQPLSEKKPKRNRLCRACRIDQNTLPSPQLPTAEYPQYIGWLKAMATEIRRVSR